MDSRRGTAVTNSGSEVDGVDENLVLKFLPQDKSCADDMPDPGRTLS